MKDSVLVSLAILNTNWDERRRSYIDNFVPFVAECLRQADHDEVTVPELQQCLESEFGLRIPQGALNGILRRAARDKLVDRRQGVLVRKEGLKQPSDLPRKRAEALREYEALVHKLREFAAEQFKIELTEQGAVESLQNHVEERSLPILKAMISGTAHLNPFRVEHSELHPSPNPSSDPAVMTSFSAIQDLRNLPSDAFTHETSFRRAVPQPQAPPATPPCERRSSLGSRRRPLAAGLSVERGHRRQQC